MSLSKDIRKIMIAGDLWSFSDLCRAMPDTDYKLVQAALEKEIGKGRILRLNVACPRPARKGPPTKQLLLLKETK